MDDLSGKTVLVTGGSRGIGAAIARAVGGQGARVLLHYARSEAQAESLRAEIGAAHCRLVQADLAAPGGAAGLWRAATEAGERIDVLVNNAGIFKAVAVDAPAAAWRAAWSRVLQVNLLAPAELCREAILHFRRHGGGRIINVASRAAFRGEAPDQMPYGSSKGALVTLTKTIARGFAAEGVLAFCIAPGFTGTEMVTQNLDSEAIERVVAGIPLGAMAAPEEIGRLAAFLCADGVRHLTGATFDVNGASYLR
jgi:NAD(P)-dependent dehydrogenase (short-subunit alcohol dehydrogenase family)